MTTAQRIESNLRESLHPVHLELHDDSASHTGHPGAAGGGGHFTLVIVSAAFEGLSLVEQHRRVNDALRGMIGAEIHALAMRTIPASEWRGRAINPGPEGPGR